MIEFGVEAPMLERVCEIHETPLLDLTCAYPHGTGYECERWYLVRDGIVVAECSEEGTRWLRGKLDGMLTPKLAGREEDGTGGKHYTPHTVPAKIGQTDDKRSSKRRARERAKAAREGREPAEWARLQAPSRRKRAA